MKNIVSIILFILVIIACSTQESHSISDADFEKIHQLHQDYRTFWLENDSIKVVNLFSEKGGLIPPNNRGDFVKGKEAITNWWFTVANDTRYPITGFEYLEDTLLVVDSKTAIWEGVSKVRWNTVVGDSIISSSESSSNYISVFAKEGREWRILRQIWNARPKKE